MAEGIARDPFEMLGPAVVRVVCELWLRGGAGESVGTVTDLIAGRVSDRRTRRGTENLFAELEFAVEDRCRALAAEFAGVAGVERNAAIVAVGGTLDAARIAGGDLFLADLDARLLERHIRGACEPHPVRDLSAGGAALYDHVLSASCAYIIELSRGVPSIESDAFATPALQAETLEQLTELLDRVPVPDAGDRAGDGFALSYRQAVVNRLDHLDLYGVSMSDPVRRHPLTTSAAAYLSLAPGTELWDRAARMRAAGQYPTEFQPPHYPNELRWEVLSATSRLLLRGETDTGKTTLLHWLAVRAARRDYPQGMSGWNATMPFLIKLRSYVDRELPRPEQFIDEVAENFAAEMPPGWVQEHLHSGRALVLIDGIDELPEAQRTLACTWLKQLVADYPRARYLVTSRPTRSATNWLARDNFDCAELMPMSPDDVRRFVHWWHQALRDRPDRAQHETALIEAIETHSHLRELAATPRLCALLCALNADRRTHLPRGRMELYDGVLELLFGRSFEEHAITVGVPALTSREMTLLLQGFAYWLMDSGHSDAAWEDVLGQMAPTLRTIPRLREIPATDVLKHLLERGVLREPIAGRVDFIHRRFQEYLAGKAAAENEHIAALITHADDDHWSQTIVLAAGHAHLQQRTKLLRGLLDQANRTPSARTKTKLHSLAVACLETVGSLDPDLSEEIYALAGRGLDLARDVADGHEARTGTSDTPDTAAAERAQVQPPQPEPPASTNPARDGSRPSSRLTQRHEPYGTGASRTRGHGLPERWSPRPGEGPVAGR